MVAGVIVFIIGYTMLTSSPWFRRKIGGGPFEKDLKLATRIRSCMAAVGLVGAFGWVPALKLQFLSIFSMGEVWAGLFAGSIVEAFGKFSLIRSLRIALTGNDAGERARSWWMGGMNSTIPTFLHMVTEGLTLSILTFVIAVAIYVIGRAKRRRGDNQLSIFNFQLSTFTLWLALCCTAGKLARLP